MTAPRSDDLVGAVADEDLHVPRLIDDEVLAAVRGLVLGRHLSVERAHDALADFHDLSAHDAAYVGLAEALECSLVTRDRKLARSTGHGARIVVL